MQLHERWISWFLASLKVVANYEIISRVNCKTHWLLLYVAAEHLTHWTYISLSRYYTIFHSTMWYIHISTYVDCSILGWECLTHIFLSHSRLDKIFNRCLSQYQCIIMTYCINISLYIFTHPTNLHTQYICVQHNTYANWPLYYVYICTIVIYIIYVYFFHHTTGTSARVRIRAKLKHISQRSAIIETNQDSLSNGEWSGK